MNAQDEKPPFDKEIDELMNKLSEHCDSVRLFISVPSGNGETTSFSRGAGNYLAQYGQIKEWILRQETKVIEHERRGYNEGPE